MPAAAVNETVSVSEKFQSQGKTQIGNKASGTVQIYNFTKLPINLKALTTVLSFGGKTYTLSRTYGNKADRYTNARTKRLTRLAGAIGGSYSHPGGDDYNLPAGNASGNKQPDFWQPPPAFIRESRFGNNRRHHQVSFGNFPERFDSCQNPVGSRSLKQVRSKLVFGRRRFGGRRV